MEQKLVFIRIMSDSNHLKSKQHYKMYQHHGFQFKPVLHVFAVIQTPMIQIPVDVIKSVEVVAIDASVVLPDKRKTPSKTV